MGNLFKAHIFKERTRGPREEVKIKLFNLDSSPLDIGSGGGGVPRWAKVFWNFANPNYVPQNGNLSFDDVDMGQTRFEGLETNDTKLILPPGVYIYRLQYSNNVGNTTGTYYGIAADFNYDWVEGMGDPAYPEQLSLDTGGGAQDNFGRDLPYSASAMNDGWGISEINSYVEISPNHDFTNLPGGVQFYIAKLEAF